MTIEFLPGDRVKILDGHQHEFPWVGSTMDRTVGCIGQVLENSIEISDSIHVEIFDGESYYHFYYPPSALKILPRFRPGDRVWIWAKDKYGATKTDERGREVVRWTPCMLDDYDRAVGALVGIVKDRQIHGGAHPHWVSVRLENDHEWWYNEGELRLQEPMVDICEYVVVREGNNHDGEINGQGIVAERGRNYIQVEGRSDVLVSAWARVLEPPSGRGSDEDDPYVHVSILDEDPYEGEEV